MSRCWVGLLAVLGLAVAAPQANATVVFSASGSGLSATASFTISGPAGARQLEILLTNTDAATGGAAPDASNEVLTGLFFNLGTSAFTPVSATVDNVSGTIIQTDECDSVGCAGKTNVGGEFSYAFGGASWLDGTNQGISSSGYLNANTSAGNFSGPDYDSPGALNGINFGIVPAEWDAYSGNGGLDNDPLIAGTVRFVLSSTIPDGLTEEQISDVYFTYGTSSSERSLPATTGGAGTTGGGTTGGVPEPAMLSMVGLALAAAGYRLRKAGTQG